MESFCKTVLKNPEMINCMEDSLTLVGITQYIAKVREESLKVKLINKFFRSLSIEKCIIFTNRYSNCQPLAVML